VFSPLSLQKRIELKTKIYIPITTLNL